MSHAIDELAQAYGIELSYVSETGEHRVVPDEVKRALLAAMGVEAGDDAAVASSLAHVSQSRVEGARSAELRQCFVPEWLKNGRVWGISCQLYGLRSQRNHGIGDFEDLAQLCEIGAAAGADFVGANPLHALFSSDPERASPYSPSTRQFLNPLYIAVDRVAGTARALSSLPAAELEAVRRADLVDYPAVARLKRKVLEQAFAEQDPDPDFARFREEGGAALEAFATFEALSEAMSISGSGAGWHGWPEEYRDSRSPAVASFAREYRRRVDFHAWLQCLATSQLAEVQRRARAAGMRMGLYLDLAVGVAPDGAATWAEPDLVVTGARIGAPPDLFNANGQDWGLAPLSPAGLKKRNLEPFARDIAAQMRHAGAIRIDHAMGLQRVFWIPGAAKPSGGSYVRYPLNLLLEKLAEASHEHRTVVIGEDLGTVPEGFRDRMCEAEVQSYRVMLFERGEDGRFLPPDTYPREAMACLTTHDLPTQTGWWEGHDIALREKLGLFAGEEADRARRERAEDRARVADALATAGIIGQAARDAAASAADLPEAIATGAHVYVARTPSRLMVAQIEDLTGELEQVNLPGTHMEYPNWRRVLATRLEDLLSHPRFRDATAAMASERPRSL
jgi:4-alpha-glucanotransferase